MKRLLCWTSILSLVLLANSAPVKRGGYVDDKVQHYLMKFGYLPQSDLETGSLRTEESLRDAIRDLQRFGGLEPTGDIDDATRRLLSRKRCGLPDKADDSFQRRFKRYTLQGQTWGYTNLTWSLQTKYPRGLDQGRVRYVLSRALDVWAQNSKLTFQELDSAEADILVSFQRGYHNDGYPFDGKGQILAHAFFPNSGRGGDVHFDEEEIWLTEDNDDNEEGTSLFLVAAHEFGHSLGLSHSSVDGALMYPWYQGLKPNFELPDDDKHGIQQMYGAKEERLWGRNPPYNPHHPQHSPTSAPTRPTRPTERTTRRPYYPRHYPKYPHKPDQDPKYPYKPYYPGKHFPPNRDPERKYPDGRVHTHNKHYPERIPPERKYPHSNSPPNYPDPRYTPEKPTTQRPAPTRYPDRTHYTTKEPVKSEKPDTCDTSYDAISVIRREVFIFKDEYLWRIGDSGLNSNYPVEIIRMWNGLPKNLSRVDAVYERPDNKIVFFIGNQYFVHNGNDVERGYPKPLTNLGLPPSLERIDGAMVWGHNGKTYFYSGTMYWRFDEDLGKVELDYPRDMSMWKGVGYNIDTVFQWKDGKTYFFKGKGFWKFNDLRMRVENEQQTLSAPFWMGCPRPLEGPNTRTKEKFVSEPVSSGLLSQTPPSVFIFSVVLAFSCRLWTFIT